MSMTFIKRLCQFKYSGGRRIYNAALVLTATALISACQLAPSSDEGSVTKDQKDTDSEEAVVLTVNPYLDNRSSVPSLAAGIFSKALSAINQQQWADAKSYLTSLTENYPNLSGPFVNLGLVNIELDDMKSAEAAFQQAINANGNNVNAYNHYGVFLRKQGRFDEAKKMLLQALELWPDYPDGHLNLGILYDLYQGEHQQALHHYERYQALQSEPGRKLRGWIVDLQRRIKAEQGG